MGEEPACKGYYLAEAMPWGSAVGVFCAAAAAAAELAEAPRPVS